MDSRDVTVPGRRDVRATLDAPTPDSNRTDALAGGDVDEDQEHVADACVVTCPPHPQHGGNRGDGRLTAVAGALAVEGVACLRFDYGPWDEGDGETSDALDAAAWAADRYDRVGLFGYSFGGAVALLAAAALDPDAGAVSVLAPAPRLGADRDAADALDAVDAPVQVRYGERDSTVDSTPVAERARELGHDVAALPADHFFVGQREAVAGEISAFLVDALV